MSGPVRSPPGQDVYSMKTFLYGRQTGILEELVHDHLEGGREEGPQGSGRGEVRSVGR